MFIDTWDTNTFDSELVQILSKNNTLIKKYYFEEARINNEYLNQETDILNPQPRGRNQYNADIIDFSEKIISPMMYKRSLRVWHYTRLLDSEIEGFIKKIETCSFEFLETRLEHVVNEEQLTKDEANFILDKSVLQNSEQNNGRVGHFSTITVPVSCKDEGVGELLAFWGGETVYFWLRNENIEKKLHSIGTPYIMEIKIDLTDRLNSFSVTEEIIRSWAIKLGAQITNGSSDLFIYDSVVNAEVIKIHSRNDNSFFEIGLKYPQSINCFRNDL